MKKIISLFSALAVSASMLAAFATTSFAAPTAVSSNPEIQGFVADELDADGYAVLKFKLVNNEVLNYSASKGKVTSNAINLVQVGVTLDSEVFDTTETYITPSTSGINVTGDNTSTLTYLASPTTVDTYWTAVPEQLFEIAVLLNDGYTLDNIPSDSVTFGEVIVEYTAYKGVKPAENNLAEQETTDNGTYTIYGANVPTYHYPITVGFTGTAATEPEEPELVENQYVFSFDADEETDIKIINSRTGDKTYDLPDFVKGTMKVWGLLKFSGNEDVQAGDTFTIKTAKNRVELETIKTITVQAADLQ